MASCRITYVCIIIYKQSYHRFIFSLLSVFSLIPLIVVRLKRLFVQTYYPFYSRWVIYLSARFLLLPMETNGRSLSDIFIHLYIYISVVERCSYSSSLSSHIRGCRLDDNVDIIVYCHVLPCTFHVVFTAVELHCPCFTVWTQ